MTELEIVGAEEDYPRLIHARVLTSSTEVVLALQPSKRRGAFATVRLGMPGGLEGGVAWSVDGGPDAPSMRSEFTQIGRASLPRERILELIRWTWEGLEPEGPSDLRGRWQGELNLTVELRREMGMAGTLTLRPGRSGWDWTLVRTFGEEHTGTKCPYLIDAIREGLTTAMLLCVGMNFTKSGAPWMDVVPARALMEEALGFTRLRRGFEVSLWHRARPPWRAPGFMAMLLSGFTVSSEWLLRVDVGRLDVLRRGKQIWSSPLHEVVMRHEQGRIYLEGGGRTMELKTWYDANMLEVLVAEVEKVKADYGSPKDVPGDLQVVRRS